MRCPVQRQRAVTVRDKAGMQIKGIITDSAGEPAARNVPVRWDGLTRGVAAAAAKAGEARGRRGAAVEHAWSCVGLGWVGLGRVADFILP